MNAKSHGMNLAYLDSCTADGVPNDVGQRQPGNAVVEPPAWNRGLSFAAN